MTRSRTVMWPSRRVLPSICSIFLFAYLSTPVLHAQGGAVDRNSIDRTSVGQDQTVEQDQTLEHNQNGIEAAEAEDAVVQPNAAANIVEGEPGEAVGTASEDAQGPATQAQTNPNPAATYQPVTWKNLPRRVLGDQKLVWLFPLHVAEGQHVLPTLGVVGVTGGLIAADPHIERHLRNNTAAFDEYDEIFSGANTGIVTALVPATFYLYGLAHKSSYAEQTGLLAGEAYLDSAIPEVALKLISRRTRPSAVPAGNDYTDTFFAAHVSLFGKGSSFPSGHAAGIFSVATVVAERYRQHRWVPWVMYGLAAAISFSRVPTFAHFPSDVFLGAALGYTITRFDVLRDRTR